MAVPVSRHHLHALGISAYRRMKNRQKERRRVNRDDESENHSATRCAGIARNPKMGKARPSILWKDRHGERANRKFNAGPDAELRHADRRVELNERTRLRKTEKLTRRIAHLAGIAACADLEDEGTDWGDDDAETVTHHTVAQDAESTYA